MHYAALASGSKGNCHAFLEGGRIFLVDAGISLKQIRLRLQALDWDPAAVGAVAITHEHSDHIAALPVLMRNTDWVFMMTGETQRAVETIQGIAFPPSRILPLRPGFATDWEGARILPFSIPHDASDPVAYRIEWGGRNAAVVTDLGQPTALVADHCADLDLLTLEANHDVDMLRNGNYPPPLKARILSRIGHLSNASMGELLGRLLSSRLADVVLAHLSEQNNDPALARFAAEEVLRGHGATLHVASQRDPLRVAARTK